MPKHPEHKTIANEKVRCPWCHRKALGPPTDDEGNKVGRPVCSHHFGVETQHVAVGNDPDALRNEIGALKRRLAAVEERMRMLDGRRAK